MLRALGKATKNTGSKLTHSKLERERQSHHIKHTLQRDFATKQKTLEQTSAEQHDKEMNNSNVSNMSDESSSLSDISEESSYSQSSEYPQGQKTELHDNNIVELEEAKEELTNTLENMGQHFKVAEQEFNLAFNEFMKAKNIIDQKLGKALMDNIGNKLLIKKTTQSIEDLNPPKSIKELKTSTEVFKLDEELMGHEQSSATKSTNHYNTMFNNKAMQHYSFARAEQKKSGYKEDHFVVKSFDEVFNTEGHIVIKGTVVKCEIGRPLLFLKEAKIEMIDNKETVTLDWETTPGMFYTDDPRAIHEAGGPHSKKLNELLQTYHMPIDIIYMRVTKEMIRKYGRQGDDKKIEIGETINNHHIHKTIIEKPGTQIAIPDAEIRQELAKQTFLIVHKPVSQESLVTDEIAKQSKKEDIYTFVDIDKKTGLVKSIRNKTVQELKEQGMNIKITDDHVEDMTPEELRHFQL